MYYHDHKKVRKEQIAGGIQRRLTHLDKLMTVVIDFTGGPMSKADPYHSHPHEQITYVAKGSLEVYVGEEKAVLVEGDMFRVPSNVPHTIRTLTEHVRLVDSFSPPREDFL